MAYFSVNGGYKFVCSLNSAAPLADRLLANGPGPGGVTTARDLADLTGSGLVEVARHAWVRIRRRGGHRVRRDLSGLSSKGVADAMDEEDRDPSLSAPPAKPPGTDAQVRLLTRAQKTIEIPPTAYDHPQ